MHTVDFAGLEKLPAGTIFCEVEDGFSRALDRKGESLPEGGFWRNELLPQDLASFPAPWRFATWCPPGGYDEGTTFHVLTRDEVATLVRLLTADEPTLRAIEKELDHRCQS